MFRTNRTGLKEANEILNGSNGSISQNKIDTLGVMIDHKSNLQATKVSILSVIEDFFDKMEGKISKYQIDNIQNDIQANINEVQKYYRKIQKKDYIKFLIISKQGEKTRQQLIQKYDKQIQKSSKYQNIKINPDITDKIQEILYKNIQIIIQDQEFNNDSQKSNQLTIKQPIFNEEYQQEQQNMNPQLQNSQPNQPQIPLQIPLYQQQLPLTPMNQQQNSQKPPIKRSFNAQQQYQQVQFVQNPYLQKNIKTQDQYDNIQKDHQVQQQSFFHQVPVTQFIAINHQQQVSSQQQQINQNQQNQPLQLVQQHQLIQNQLQNPQLQQHQHSLQPQLINQQNLLAQQQYNYGNNIIVPQKQYQNNQQNQQILLQQNQNQIQNQVQINPLQNHNVPVLQGSSQKENIFTPSYKSPFQDLSPIKNVHNQSINYQLDNNTNLIQKAKLLLEKQNYLKPTFEENEFTDNKDNGIENIIIQQQQIQDRLQKIKQDHDLKF